MELLEFFLLGVIFTVGVFAMAYMSIKITMPWYAWSGMIGGGLLFLFGLGWAGSSFVEDIPQSGALGLAIFCMPALLLMAFIWRKFVPKGFKF